MTQKRSPFPPVFWIANSVEILERFAYYGIYMGFGIYFNMLGFKTEQLGPIQGLFLAISYTVPIFSGTFADKIGFKKMLLIAYLAYLPSILLLIITHSFTGIALTMLCIGFAAGIFKPLVSGTVRVVTDSTNRTLGYGIFYAMVNIGATLGPLILGHLRATSWKNAYMIAAAAIGFMFLITLFFYKEPPRAIEGETLRKKFSDMGTALSDHKFALFLVILGIFFWTPFWTFYNLISRYVEFSLDGAALYVNIRSILGRHVADFLSRDVNGTRRVLGETISNTAYAIVVFQIGITWIFERYRPVRSFIFGLLIIAAGFGFMCIAGIGNPAWIFLGILLFAFGEMISSPRIQEYILWLAPKEKAGLYNGTNFLAVGLGGLFSGFIYTQRIYSYFERSGHPQYIWLVLGAHIILGIIVISLFTYYAGQFKEQES
jgi:proton-dependent oligopeptide transporter, POT family